MANEATVIETKQADPPVVLCIDDEKNILLALKRLFRPLGYKVLIAESGKEGIQTLENNNIDIVVSDMRMPHMSGAEVLQQVAERWPDTGRILLTGYADLDSTIAAINKGQIHQYISKPWEDSEIKLVVKGALERKRLLEEKEELTRLTETQNAKLENMNESLEEQVAMRTGELRQTVEFLELAHEQLRQSYISAIGIFSNLIEMHEGGLAGHSRRVADLSKKLAEELKLSGLEVRDIEQAALLHDIGKIGLSDALLQRPFVSLGPEEREKIDRHPVVGQAVLMGLEPLQGAAEIIRSHHERYDGKGFPDKLRGEQILPGARIVALANDFDAAQIGTLLDRRLTQKEARDFIHQNSGKRYDPAIVDAFMSLQEQESDVSERTVMTNGLKEGMVLTKDLVTDEGLLLLSRGHRLDSEMIDKIQKYESTMNRDFTIYIQ